MNTRRFAVSILLPVVLAAALLWLVVYWCDSAGAAGWIIAVFAIYFLAKYLDASYRVRKIKAGKPEKCPECLGTVNPGASKCCHCGSGLD
jgi:hypothetical protein